MYLTNIQRDCTITSYMKINIKENDIFELVK